MGDLSFKPLDYHGIQMIPAYSNLTRVNNAEVFLLQVYKIPGVYY